MKPFKFIFFIFLANFYFSFFAHAQRKTPEKINDVFYEYIQQTLSLKPEESVQIRPLVKKYLIGRRKVVAKIKDPLDREQQLLNLKIATRKEIASVIGMQKANAFFTAEQAFRRKVREELKQRKTI